MNKLQWETAEEIGIDLAARFKQIRKRRKITQQQLSALSGVSYASIKRFEESGLISLLSLTKLCMALGLSDEIKGLFTDIPYQSIDEVLREG